MYKGNKNVYTLSDEIRQQIAQSLTPLRKDEADVYRGTERRPMAAIESPAYARFLVRACGLIRECCKERNLETDRPGALRMKKSALGGYLAAEPVTQYDPTMEDLYELKWAADRRQAAIDLLPVLQPRNLQVPAGYVTEVPLSLEDLGGQSYLVFHLQDAETRAVQVMTEEQKAALAKARAPRTAPEK